MVVCDSAGHGIPSPFESFGISVRNAEKNGVGIAKLECEE